MIKSLSSPHKLLLIGLAVFIASITLGTSVAAISNEDRQRLYTPFYDPDFVATICERGLSSNLPSSIPAEYADAFSKAGAEYEINPIHIAVIHAVEQRGREFTIPIPETWPGSSSGAQGPMQFLSIAWEDYGQDGNGDGVADIQNIYDASFAAADKMSDDGLTIDSPSGSATGALIEGTFAYVMAAYNAGPGTAAEADTVADLPAETEEYIRLGLEALERFNSGAITSEPSSTTTAISCGGLGVGEELTFPLQTTKQVIEAGSVNSSGDGAVWCFDSEANCHGAGTAEEYNAADIFAAPGTIVVAATGGSVETVFSNNEYSSVRIRADNGLWYFYQHMEPGSATVRPGQSVEAGQQIGVVGDTVAAFNTAPHLHFDVATERVGISRECVREGRCDDEKTKMINSQPALIDAYSNLP